MKKYLKENLKNNLKNNLKRAGVLFLASAFTFSALTGCGSTQNASSGESAAVDGSSTAGDAKDFGKLKVSFPAGAVRVATNILALGLGYFEEEGVEVEEVALGGLDALTAINGDGDTLDVLNTGFVNDVQSIGAGYDLTFIAGTAVEGGAVFAKKGAADQFKNSDTIIDIDAVTNAKLGLVRNEAAWVITRQYLLDNGVSEDAITAIEDETSGNITYYGDSTAVALAVQAGEVDLGFTPLEYALLYADAYDLELVTPSGALSPDYVCCREVTSASRYKEKYDAFVAYETARIRAFEYYKLGETDEAVRENVVKIVCDYTGKEKDYVEVCLYGGVSKFAVDPNTVGIVNYVKAAYNSGALAGNATDFSTYDIKQNVDTGAYYEALTNLIEREPENTFYAELLEQYKNAN
ncbi:MAG: hypothetical protein ACI4D7_07185 [Lachnospiraceae bacterium]